MSNILEKQTTQDPLELKFKTTKQETLAICSGGTILASLAAKAPDQHLSGIPVYVFDLKIAIPSPSSPDSSSYESCAICLEEYKHGHQVRVLQRFDHMLNEDCVDQWLLSHSLQCPTCRNQVIETNVQTERTCCIGKTNRDPFNLVPLNFHTNALISVLLGRI